MYAGGRAPKASVEEIMQSREEFQKAMNEFGVTDLDDVDRRRNKRKYKAAYFDNLSGGFYVMQKGHEYRKDEIEVAKALALHGLQVRLQPEGDGSGGVSLKINSKTGENTYPEGKIGQIFYEQYTTLKFTSSDGSKVILRGLKHANDKGASIAVIYDKTYRSPRKLHMEDVAHGIRRYKGQPTDNPKMEFEKIYIITKLPRRKHLVVYEWHL